MATKEIDDLVASICKDALEIRNFKGKCVEFLTEVAVPAGWKDTSYRLSQGHPTYKYRKKLLTDFIDKQKSESVTVTGTTTKQFFEQLQQFSELAEANDSFSEFSSPGCPALIDLFEENLKLHGVVVRKSDTKFKASVLIKRKGRGKQHGNLSVTEHVIDLKNESKGGYRFKVGDIVEITKCARKQGVALEPEVFMYVKHNNNIDLLDCRQLNLCHVRNSINKTWIHYVQCRKVFSC